MQINQMIKQKIKHCGMSVLLVFMLTCTQNVTAKSSMAFNDVTAIVMMNSLASLDEGHFLKRLYKKLFFVPVWVEEEQLSPLAMVLLGHIEADKSLSESSKLKQDAVKLTQKAHEIYPSGTVKQKIDLEFRLSQLYKGYADYILYGSINWGAFQARLYNLRTKKIKAQWVTYKPLYSPVALLEKAALTGNLDAALKEAMPKGFHYRALRKALDRYLELEKQGGWKKVPLKGRLKVGKHYKVVPLLRERLALSGDLQGCSTEDTVYDTCLKNAVIRFQRRHGLEAKGIIGKRTIAALNVPLEQRIKQIRLNLDRIKWLYQRVSKYHILVNIPAFTLFFEKNGKCIQQMRVITGRKKNPTPIFSDSVSTIVLNPYWNVPKSIIQKEMIPKLLKNPNAMAKKGIEIRAGWGKNAKKIRPDTIDWSQYRYSKRVPFRFAQLPGKRNALGKIKFLFPNQFAVYMHDTPNKHLFNRTVRAFSHGCIRLHKPRELLKTFSTFNESIDFQKAQEYLKGRKKVSLSLEHRVPVDVVYLTAYVDYQGILQFRDDIYGYDKMQLQSYRRW